MFSWFGLALSVIVPEPLYVTAVIAESPEPTICTNVAICITSPLTAVLTNTTEVPFVAV